LQRKFFTLFLGICIFACALPVYAAKAQVPAKIIFVPQDNRPISDQQTAEVVRKLGYEVVVPPKEMLGGRSDLGHPDELWQWAEENAKDADAAVFSSDAMIYGSLVASRKHNYEKQQVLERADRFAQFRKKHPKLKMYAFGSIMRTPRTGEASGSEEPGYYANYGSDIFRYTALTDKKEMGGLTKRETKEYSFLTELIPKQAMRDWMNRRQKNFVVSSYLINITRQGAFDYFVLGRDDNAPYSQTHMESRKLAKAGADLGQAKFQAMAGIDEIGLLLLTRAVNDLTHTVPFVDVIYNWGAGANTVPSYSDEPIADSIRSHTVAAGGMIVSSPRKADVVLLVNTNPSGKTGEANERSNDGTPRDGTKYFAGLVSESVEAGYPVALGDIAYANGADNALMAELKNRGLLFKLRAYAGWNTATNSTGFVLGTGMLASRMTDEARDSLLLMRYMDDWAYQANVRQVLGRQLGWLRGSGAYASLDGKLLAVEARATRMMRRFADDNLPPLDELRSFEITFPWNRMFEACITFG
jgi:hypothetical protein